MKLVLQISAGIILAQILVAVLEFIMLSAFRPTF